MISKLNISDIEKIISQEKIQISKTIANFLKFLRIRIY